MTSSFDFAPLFPAGLPAPSARWTGLAKYSFVGGNNDSEQLPLEGLIEATNSALQKEGRSLATYGLAHGPQGYLPLREFLVTKLKRDAGINCTVDDLLIVSGSLQALDLVNATLLTRGDTVIFEQDSYQGSLTRLARLGVNVVGIPLDKDGMRMDVLASTLADLKGRGIRPKYIYTIPTVQNPTGSIMPESRRTELVRLAAEYGVPIFEDDCYADLVWSGQRPQAIHAMSPNGGVIHIGSFSKSIAPALRVGFIVAPWDVMSRMLALKTDAAPARWSRWCWPPIASRISHPRAGADEGAAHQARYADGGAERAVRDGGRVRGAQGRHLPVGEAARPGRYAETLSGRARRRRVDQSGPGMVDQQAPFQLAAQAVLCEPLASADP